MTKEQIEKLKGNIVAIGVLLWEKDLASGLNGNISLRLDEETILLTAHGTCLGLLQEKDILLLKLDGQLLEEGSVSTEKLLHTEIYKNFPDIKAIVHTHSTFTNGYFLDNKKFEPRIFEAKFYLGDVPTIDQVTPAVTDAVPVIRALKNNNIVVLRHHGVVAVGQDLFDCFLLIQSLEEAIKTEAVSRLYASDHRSLSTDNIKSVQSSSSNTQMVKRYKLFSKEQIDEIVRLVNSDAQLTDLGQKSKMTMDLAVTLDETNQSFCFRFDNGQIKEVRSDNNAEFVINAPEKVWRAVFNREIDPFVATTQKKMHLKGDFAKISRWYAPCSRIFELWQKVPVE